MAKRYVLAEREFAVPSLRSALPFLLPALVIVALAILILPSDNGGNSPDSENSVALTGALTPDSAASGSNGPDGSALTPESAAFQASLPTPTVRLIRRPTMAAPSPTANPTPIYLPEQYVENGGFEDGLTSWYVEPGAVITNALVRRGEAAIRIAASGGFASSQISVVAGQTYRLSAWGMLSAAGDTGQIGISYFDALGRRLQSDEPEPLVFTSQEFARLARTFTPVPGAVRVQVYVWKPSGTSTFVVDDISVRAFASDPAEDEG